MGLKIGWRNKSFLPLVILIIVFLAFTIGFLSKETSASLARCDPVIDDPTCADQVQCGFGQFLCVGSGADSGVCCTSGQEVCVRNDVGGETYGQCDDALNNGNFVDVPSTASCSINVPGAGYCGGSCKQTIQILPDECTKKITLTSMYLDDEGQTAAGGNVVASDYSCTCRSGSTPLGTCAIYPTGPDGTCSGGTTCGAQSGDGFGGTQCTGTRNYNTYIPFIRGIPLSAYIYALDDCKSRGSGIWGQGQATYTETRAQCDPGYTCDTSTGIVQCITTPSCGNSICETGEDSTSCPQDCQAQQICGNNLKEGNESCDGTDLFGQTCQSVNSSFTGGTLGCTTSCTFDTTQCTTPAVINNPIGNHDTSNCTVSTGWVCDADNYNQELSVEIYADGQKDGSGILIASVLSNIPREQAVANQCGGNPNHGFIFDTPQNLNDGVNHQLYIYGINTGSGNDVLLSNSPRTINCAPPAPSCVFNSASWEINQTLQGNVVDLSVITSNCQGQVISIAVRESDVFPLTDTPANVNPSNVVVDSAGIATSSWTAEWIDDGTLQGNPEYIFTATLVSNPGTNIDSSNQLEVLQISPPMCSNTVSCADYVNQTDCQNDICNVASNSVPSTVDCSTPGTCSCSWDTNTTSCRSSVATTNSSGSDIGTCFYTENGADTCDDDGFLTVDLTASWVWDPGCDASCQSNNQGFVADCQSTTESFQCPAQIPLPFFNIYNVLAAVVLIALVYWAISMRKREKKIGKKAGKR